LCIARPTPGAHSGDNATVRLDLHNEPQPDAYLRVDEACDGNARVTHNDFLEGALELSVEIAGTSAAYDLHDKMEAYRRNGVREYRVWRVYDGRLDWFWLKGEEYKRLRPRAGIIRSQVFPGLRLDGEAILTGDLVRRLQVRHEGLASPEHARFVTQLSKRRK